MVAFHVEGPSNDNLITGIDTVLPFLLQKSGIRGRFVRLEGVLQEILSKHHYPKAVEYLLAEGLLIASQLGTMLKHTGSVTLQAKGNGPIELMVISCTHDGGLRGYIKPRDNSNFRGLRPGTPMSKLFGQGNLAILMHQADRNQQYQGIVGLDGDSLSAAMERYFKESEQLDTYFNLHITPGERRKTWSGGGIMLQYLPSDASHADDHTHSKEALMEEALILSRTLTEQELRDAKLTSHELLYRLFHEQHVIVYNPVEITHRCSCSKERMTEMIQTFSPEQRKDMQQDGVIEITCQFCSHTEIFTEEDLRKLPYIPSTH